MAERTKMLEEGLYLLEQGIAAHHLRKRSKAPVEDGWSKAEVHSLESFEDDYRNGYNLGIRLGEPSRLSNGNYLYVLDLDIRQPELKDEAVAVLKELLGPLLGKVGIVRSGSGGESRHLYFESPALFRSKKLAHSKHKFKGKDGKDHWAWEIELFGTGKQVACPPSIHPDTGKPYEWLRDFVLGKVVISEETLTEWTGRKASDDDAAPASDLRSVIGRLNWPHKKLRTVLEALDHDDFCEDRDGWIRVGMALHHETGGSNDGLDLYHEFSSGSGKYDEGDLDRVWESFGKGNGSKPVRFVTLVKAAGKVEMLHEQPLDEDDEAEETEEEKSDLEDGEEPDDLSWTALLHLDEEGKIKPTVYNVGIILRHDARTRGLFGWNTFAQAIYYRTPPGVYIAAKRKIRDRCVQLKGPIWVITDKLNGMQWQDHHEDSLREMLSAPRNRGGWGLQISDRDLKSAKTTVAWENQYHPVCEWIEQVEWDGKARIRTMVCDYLGCPRDRYHLDTSELFMIAAVARVYEPGTKFDYAPILEGPQGVRKSTFINTLGHHWAGEFTAGFENTAKIVENLRRRWVLELPELSQFAKNEVEPIKQFFATTEEQVRLAYGKNDGVFPRQSVYVGSTNQRQYLKDPTGNRRFWPWKVTVESIDTEKLEDELPQLYAEALVAYKDMRDRYPAPRLLPLYLRNAEAARIALELQSDRRIESDEEGTIGALQMWIDTPIEQARLDSGVTRFSDISEGGSEKVIRDTICGMEIWCDYFGYEMKDYARGAQLRMARTLEALGRTGDWEYLGPRKHPRYGNQKMWVRVGATRRSVGRPAANTKSGKSKFSDII